MFNAGIPCENVHSQGRRMVMISPEPNFWIHAVSSLLFLTTSVVLFFPDPINCNTNGIRSHDSRLICLSEAPVADLHVFQCYEVAKTPRPHHNKGKGAPKGKSKGKEKETDQSSRPTTIYDYLDGSIHDIALRTHFQRGYEEFKVSFRQLSIVLVANFSPLAAPRFFRLHPV